VTAHAEAPAPPRAAAGFAELYAEIQQFYAHHMQLLDAGEAQRWAELFTADASFSVPTAPEPVRGRARLVAAVRETSAHLSEQGEQHRHWLGMIDVQPQPDGSIKTRSYALVFASPRGGPSRVHRVCVCEDVLVRESGELRLSERRVTRDDLA
jgi:SnoaL-like domain